MTKMVRVQERVYGPGPRDDIEVLVAVSGDEIPEDQARSLGVAKAVDPDTRRAGDPDTDGAKALGGGWYELPDGERVKGARAARERLVALRLSQEEATNAPDDPAHPAAGNTATGQAGSAAPSGTPAGEPEGDKTAGA